MARVSKALSPRFSVHSIDAAKAAHFRADAENSYISNS